jgi:hypothetical protein
MQVDKPSPQVKKDVSKDADTGGLLYHQLRKLISIVVSIAAQTEYLILQKSKLKSVG